MTEFGSEISLEALNHMEVLQRNITEALRINPPLTLLLRQVKKSFAVTTSSGKTHIVPKVQISSASCIRELQTTGQILVVTLCIALHTGCITVQLTQVHLC